MCGCAEAWTTTPPLTISMIRVFFPARFFLATMYCARTTPPKRIHTLALAAAPTFTTAVLSMAGCRVPPPRLRWCPFSLRQHGPSLQTGVQRRMCSERPAIPRPNIRTRGGTRIPQPPETTIEMHTMYSKYEQSLNT